MRGHAHRGHQQIFLFGANNWKQDNVELNFSLLVLLRSSREKKKTIQKIMEKVSQAKWGMTSFFFKKLIFFLVCEEGC